MRQSQYNLITKYDEDTNLLYNVLNRSFLVFNNEKTDLISKLLSTGQYEKGTEEKDVFLKLVTKNFIIEDDFSEYDYMFYQENLRRYNDMLLSLMIMPTMNCNFNCTYCYQDNYKKNLKEEDETKIIEFINTYTDKVKKVKLAWFGGEPTLEHERVIRMTKKIKEICDYKKVDLDLHMTTNGYLLNQERIEAYKSLGFNCFQITLDGPKEIHNSRRMLHNGEGTFDKISENILKILECGMKVTFRLNLDQSNIQYAESLFDMIPVHFRHLVWLSMGNLHQEENKISFYELYKKSIDFGYTYKDIQNNYAVCESNYKHGYTIGPSGEFIFCSFAEDDSSMNLGKLDDDGRFIITNPTVYYKSKSVSALNSESCKKCFNLPICIGSCPKKRLKDNDSCLGLGADGMNAEERAKIHYYHSKVNNLLDLGDFI